MAITCKYCKRNFPSSKALGQHQRSKHFKNYVMPYIAIVAIIGIGIALVWIMMPRLSSSEPPLSLSNTPILDRTISSHDSLLLHYHADLAISVDGRPIEVPANIGVSGNAFRYIHTHDDTGKIHIESPSNHVFSLADFFTVWGKEFSNECVDNNCGNVVVRVNGNVIVSATDYILQDGDNILIDVSTK